MVFMDKTLFEELKAFSEINNSRENISFYEGVLILEDLLRDHSPQYLSANPRDAPPAILRRFLARHQQPTEPANRRPLSYSPLPCTKQQHRPLSASPVPSFTSGRFTPLDFTASNPDSNHETVVIVPPPLYRHYKYIYDFFISPTAPVEINCSWPARRQAAAAIASAFRSFGDSTVVVRSDAFDMCADEVLDLIWNGTFRSFVTLRGLATPAVVVGDSLADVERLIPKSKCGRSSPGGSSPSLRPVATPSPSCGPQRDDIAGTPSSPFLLPSTPSLTSPLTNSSASSSSISTSSISTDSDHQPKRHRLKKLMRRMSQPSVAIEDAVRFMNMNKARRANNGQTPTSPTSFSFTFPTQSSDPVPPVPRLNLPSCPSKQQQPPPITSPKPRKSRRGSVEPLPLPPSSLPPTLSSTPPYLQPGSTTLPRISDISESDLDTIREASSSPQKYGSLREGRVLSPDEAKERYQAAVEGRRAKKKEGVAVLGGSVESL
ncbi:hypothetical protein HDV00_002297 [Rhizophlyctis rosea]|nr:hypothetical protein HDV00_002297 [Rhizophlyctis rosea]